jgi:hypothetical protein
MPIDPAWLEANASAEQKLPIRVGITARLAFRVLIRDDAGSITIDGVKYKAQDLTGCAISATVTSRSYGTINASAAVDGAAADGRIVMTISKVTTSGLRKPAQDTDIGRYAVTVDDGTTAIRPIAGPIILMAD